MNSIVKQNGSKLEENGEISVSHSVNTRKDRRCPEWLLLTRISCFLIVCTKIVSIRNMALWEEAALESERWGYKTERGCLMSPVNNICNTATAQHQKERHDLVHILSSNTFLVSWHKFSCFLAELILGVNVMILGDRTWLNSFVCTRLVCLTAIRSNDSINSTSLAKAVIVKDILNFGPCIRVSWCLFC